MSKVNLSLCISTHSHKKIASIIRKKSELQSLSRQQWIIEAILKKISREERELEKIRKENPEVPPGIKRICCDLTPALYSKIKAHLEQAKSISNPHTTMASWISSAISEELDQGG